MRLHREWVIRGFAIGIGVSTIRVFYDVFLFLSDISAYENIGISFWLGWSVSLLVAEIWIGITRKKPGEAAQPIPCLEVDG